MGTKWWASKARSTWNWMKSQDAQEAAIQSPAQGLGQFPRGLQQPNSAAGGLASHLGPRASCAKGKPSNRKANSAKGPDIVSVLSPHSLFSHLYFDASLSNQVETSTKHLPVGKLPKDWLSGGRHRQMPSHVLAQLHLVVKMHWTKCVHWHPGQTEEHCRSGHIQRSHRCNYI